MTPNRASSASSTSSAETATALLDMERERPAFELWVLSLEHWPATRSSEVFERSTAVPDMYYNSSLSNMWRGWMASATGWAAERARCIATLEALKDASGVNDDGQAWLVRLTRGDCVAALKALRPNGHAHLHEPAQGQTK